MELLVDTLMSQQYMFSAAIVIHIIVRVLKEPGPWGYLVAWIPSRMRSLVAILLGFVAAGLDSVIAGTDWKEALTRGLIAALLAILGHDLVIEWIRGGKEIGR